MRRFHLALCVAVLTSACASAPPRSIEAVHRTAVISAFPPELAVLKSDVRDRTELTLNGVTFIVGRLAGKDVVLFLSGVSMVNAAMTTQMALDHFTIDRIVFSGIAGGVDPGLNVGDVVVAAEWGQYLEGVMARQSPSGYRRPTEGWGADDAFANFGMFFPSSVDVARGSAAPERKFWFAADPAMLAIARSIAPGVTLKRCAGETCLANEPVVRVGGNGVSGAAFVDNAELREWAFRTFNARVLDMETAATGQVAYLNHKPFIAFRSLSDLAGGDPGKNQARTFFQLASDNSAAVVKAFLEALPLSPGDRR